MDGQHQEMGRSQLHRVLYEGKKKTEQSEVSLQPSFHEETAWNDDDEHLYHSAKVFRTVNKTEV